MMSSGQTQLIIDKKRNVKSEATSTAFRGSLTVNIAGPPFFQSHPSPCSVARQRTVSVFRKTHRKRKSRSSTEKVVVASAPSTKKGKVAIIYGNPTVNF